MGEPKKQKEDTASPKTPLVVAFPTIGDTRKPGKSPHDLSELFARASTSILDAGLRLPSIDSTDAKKKLEKNIPIKDGVPERFIGRVMFVGHGGPKAAPSGFFGFSGKPPPPPDDPHNFVFGGILSSALTGPDIDLLDALAARFAIGASIEVWFVNCYSGTHMTKAVATHYKAGLLTKQKKSGSVSGYTGEVAFGWDGTDPVLVLEPGGPLDHLAPGHMQFEVSESFQ